MIVVAPAFLRPAAALIGQITLCGSSCAFCAARCVHLHQLCGDPSHPIPSHPIPPHPITSHPIPSHPVVVLLLLYDNKRNKCDDDSVAGAALVSLVSCAGGRTCEFLRPDLETHPSRCTSLPILPARSPPQARCLAVARRYVLHGTPSQHFFAPWSKPSGPSRAWHRACVVCVIVCHFIRRQRAA